jgi:hypothetical protein
MHLQTELVVYGILLWNYRKYSISYKKISFPLYFLRIFLVSANLVSEYAQSLISSHIGASTLFCWLLHECFLEIGLNISWTLVSYRIGWILLLIREQHWLELNSIPTLRLNLCLGNLFREICFDCGASQPKQSVPTATRWSPSCWNYYNSLQYFETLMLHASLELEIWRWFNGQICRSWTKYFTSKLI